MLVWLSLSLCSRRINLLNFDNAPIIVGIDFRKRLPLKSRWVKLVILAMSGGMSPPTSVSAIRSSSNLLRLPYCLGIRARILVRDMERYFREDIRPNSVAIRPPIKLLLSTFKEVRWVNKFNSVGISPRKLFWLKSSSWSCSALPSSETIDPVKEFPRRSNSRRFGAGIPISVGNLPKKRFWDKLMVVRPGNLIISLGSEPLRALLWSVRTCSFPRKPSSLIS